MPVKINDYRKAMQFVAKWEWSNRSDGGYTNDVDDPGGETKWGISKRAHPNLNIKELTIEEAFDIYEKEYWNPLGCDSIDYPYNVVVMDSGINCGVSRAKDWMRKAADVKEYMRLRREYYISIVNRNPPSIKFMKGWLNRLGDLQKLVDISNG